MILLLTKKNRKVFQLSSEITTINRKIRLLSEEILTAKMNDDVYNRIYGATQKRELEIKRDELIEILKKQ